MDLRRFLAGHVSTQSQLELAAIAGAAALVAWVLYRVTTAAGAVADKAGQVAGEVVHAGDVVVSAPILAAGDVFGVPRTNPTACQQAKAEGRVWDASFACPALEFLGYIVGPTNPGDIRAGAIDFGYGGNEW